MAESRSKSAIALITKTRSTKKSTMFFIEQLFVVFRAFVAS